MKILKWNLDDAPADATEFYYSILDQAKNTGFDIPDFMLRRTATSPILKHELFEILAFTFAEIFFRGGPNYMLSKYGPRCMMTDEEPSPAQKKKALRIKQRRARESKS